MVSPSTYLNSKRLVWAILRFLELGASLLAGANPPTPTDFGLLEGYHHADVDMDDGRVSAVTGTEPKENRADESAHVMSVEAEKNQGVTVAEVNMDSALHDGRGASSTDGLPSDMLAAEVNSIASSACTPVVADSKQTGENTADHEDQSAIVLVPPEASQIDEHLHVSASSTPNETPDPMLAFVSVPDTASFFVPVPHPDISARSEEQSADHVGYADPQVPGMRMGVKPLIAELSFASTVPDYEAQDMTAFSEDGTAIANGDTQIYESTQTQERPLAEEDVVHEHHPEPPTSPTPIPSTSSPSNHDDPGKTPLKADGKGVRTPSANRVSISYAGGIRRLVINAEVVETLKVFRQEGRIEIHLNVDKGGEDDLKGILVGVSDYP
jgi:20S proteasome subunit alpha 6